MGLFRKESEDIVDITMLQKRGIIKKEEIPISSTEKIDHRTGFIELTTPINVSVQNANDSSSQSPASQTSDFLGFLDSSASQQTPSTFFQPPQNNSEVQSLKIKIDDLEFKLERLLEKLSLLENKFLER